MSDLGSELLNVGGEEDLDVEGSNLLREVEAESGGSVIDVAISVEVDELLVLSDEHEGVNEVGLKRSGGESVSDGGDVLSASLSLLGDDDVRGLDSAVVDPLEGVELDEEEVSGDVVVPGGEGVLTDVVVVGGEGSVDEVVDDGSVVGAVLVLVEALVGEVVQLGLHVVEGGEGDVGLVDVSEEGSSESSDDVSSSVGAGLADIGVVGVPDGVGEVESGLVVAVVDVLLGIESDDAPPGVEAGLVDALEGEVVKDGLGESLSEDSALVGSLEALGLVGEVEEMLGELLEVAESVGLVEVVLDGTDLEFADLGDVLVESGVSDVLDTEVGDESPELDEDVLVEVSAGNEVSDADEEDSGGVGSGVHASSLVGSSEHGGEGSEKDGEVALGHAMDFFVAEGGEEAVDSLTGVSAGGSVELFGLDEVGGEDLSETASGEDVGGGSLDVVVVDSGGGDVGGVVLHVVEESGEEVGGGELAHLVGVVVALGVGLVVEESVLEVSEDLEVSIDIEVLLTSVVGSVEQVSDSLIADLSLVQRLVSIGASDEADEQESDLELHCA